MNFEIKSWVNGSVLFSLECGSLKVCVEAAVKQGADLRGAYLRGAYLRGAYLQGVKNINEAKDAKILLAQLRICPQEGAFVGWKKLTGGVIAKLVIPHDAERLNSYGSRKCRASKAFVHELFGADCATDTHSGALKYKQGIEVFPDSFDPDPKVECSHGIHFFITREEAEDY